MPSTLAAAIADLLRAMSLENPGEAKTKAQGQECQIVKLAPPEPVYDAPR